MNSHRFPSYQFSTKCLPVPRRDTVVVKVTERPVELTLPLAAFLCPMTYSNASSIGCGIGRSPAMYRRILRSVVPISRAASSANVSRYTLRDDGYPIRVHVILTIFWKPQCPKGRVDAHTHLTVGSQED